MGYYSTCILNLEFSSELEAEMAMIKLVEEAPGDTPMEKNYNITKGTVDGKDFFYISLNNCFVNMGDYKKWIPIVAKSQGLTWGSMEVFGEEVGDIWKIEFKDGSFTAFSSRIEYDETELRYL